MKLKYYGYKEKKVEVRELTLADLKLHIIAGYVEHGVREVQLIDITSGESTTFKTIEDVTKNEWCADCKVELINLPHGYGTDKEHKTVIIFQQAEEGERVIC